MERLEDMSSHDGGDTDEAASLLREISQKLNGFEQVNKTQGETHAFTPLSVEEIETQTPEQRTLLEAAQRIG